MSHSLKDDQRNQETIQYTHPVNKA